MTQFFHDIEENRDEKDRDAGGCKHSSDDSGTHDLPRQGTGTSGGEGTRMGRKKGDQVFLTKGGDKATLGRSGPGPGAGARRPKK